MEGGSGSISTIFKQISIYTSIVIGCISGVGSLNKISSKI